MLRRLLHSDFVSSAAISSTAEAVKVSESGISNPATIRQLMQAGFKGFLIGESFMKQDNPGEALAKFTEEI